MSCSTSLGKEQHPWAKERYLINRPVFINLASTVFSGRGPQGLGLRKKGEKYVKDLTPGFSKQSTVALPSQTEGSDSFITMELA